MFVGNQSPTNRGVLSGSGKAKSRFPVGQLTVTGKAGEVVYVPCADILAVNSPGFSIKAQAVGGNVSISVTLAPADLATSPVQDVSGIWSSATAVAAGSIVEIPTGSAYRISFTANAIVYMVAV